LRCRFQDPSSLIVVNEPIKVFYDQFANLTKSEKYQQVLARIEALLTEDADWTAAMATVVCELHGSFDHYHWTGFYRVVRHEHLQVGPYQGGHGCIDISFDRGVCGAAAKQGKTQLVDDVEKFPGHIACSGSTRSEIVVPVRDAGGDVIAVLDVDSDFEAAFDETDQKFLETLCRDLGARWGDTV